jgi:hypothetical protein
MIKIVGFIVSGRKFVIIVLENRDIRLRDIDTSDLSDVDLDSDIDQELDEAFEF